MGDIYVLKSSSPKTDSCETPCLMETVEEL